MIKKVKIRFIRSYLLVMLVVVLILSVLTSVSLRMVGADLEHKNELILDYVRNTLDKSLSEVNLLGYEITGNPWLTTHEAGEFTMAEAVRITRYLDMLDSSNSIIRDIGIYFPEYNLVVNDVGRFLPRHYYLLYCRYTELGPEQWLAEIRKQKSLEWQLRRVRNVADSGQFLITLTHTLDRSVPEGTSPVLLITLDNAEIEFMMRSNNMDNSEMFALLTEKGETIHATGNRDMLSTLSVSWHENNAGRVVTSDSSLVVSEARSNYLGIRYVSVSQRSSFEGALYPVRLVMVVGSVVAVAIGILCAVWLTRRNIQPLQDLSETICVTDGDAPDDIYDAIGENIRSLMLENNSARVRMEKQRSVLKTMFVASLLRGEITGERQFIDHCTGCGIDFKDMLHSAFVLYIRAVPAQIAENTGEDDLLMTLLETSVRGRRGMFGCDAEIAHMDGFYTGWLMLPDVQDAADRCEAYLNALTEYMEKTYSVRAIAVSGSICESFQQIPESRDEAMQMLNTVSIQHLNRNLTRRDAESGFGKAARGNMDIYGAFVNCLRVQDFSGAGKMLEKLLQEYLNVYLPRQVYVLRKQTVLSVMLDALEQAAQTGDAEAVAECKAGLKAAELPDEFAAAMENALGMLETMQSRSQKETSRKNVEQIREYIDQNFANPDMGLALLSQEFSMSSAYLSRFIKAELGAGILDYVNKRRVEEACHLLKETNLTVKQIAQAVGYISDITFIRVFKQYEGTTPGKYRGMMEKPAKQGDFEG